LPPDRGADGSIKVLPGNRPRGQAAFGFAVFAAGLILALAAATSASAAFGFDELELSFADADGVPVTQAGSHPDEWRTGLTVETKLEDGEEVPVEYLKDLQIDFPPGLVGVPALFPRCSRADFFAESCPGGSVLGTASLTTSLTSAEGEEFTLYNLEPEPGSVAELGFIAVGLVPITIELTINPEPPHNVRARITKVPVGPIYLGTNIYFLGTEITIKGNEGTVPFLTLPRSCDRPLAAIFSSDSWEAPGTWTDPVTVPAAQGGALTGCGALSFAPSVSVAPTSAASGGPTGLDLDFGFDDPGLTSVTGTAEADLRRAVISLPQGMAVNPAVGEGLAACTPAQLAAETPTSGPGEGCPEAAKIGTGTIASPLLEGPLRGSVFIAQPDAPETAAPGAENPFDSLLALYVVFKSSARGILIVQPVHVEADPRTGRLTATISEIPELPFSRLHLRLREGPHGPLLMPRTCGTHLVRSSLFPSSGEPALAESTAFPVAGDCGGESFDPKLVAGSSEAGAGASSPFLIRLDLGAREQNPERLDLVLPAGVSAAFGAVKPCPEPAVAGGSCPASSRVGEVRIAAGGGAEPTWLPSGGPGGVFLAGPVGGAPFSLALAVPAVAGPFDLGTVALRAPIFVDRRTAQAEVRLVGLPQILDGVPIQYRSLRLFLDREGFIHNPTSCTAKSVAVTVRSVRGAEARPRDDFEVGDCAALPFGPKVSTRLLGSTHRGAHPQLRAAIATRRGEANLRRATVIWPGSELLDFRHVRAVCSRADFSAGSCPASAAYGRVAVRTPLLRQPLAGPVYLREGATRLPELAVSLAGELGLDLTGRIDSVGGRLRTTFTALPDVPLRKVVLTMDGGPHGLIVNSGGVCRSRPRTQARLLAHSGRRFEAGPRLRAPCPRRR
jgi:hypothetical protein